MATNTAINSTGQGDLSVAAISDQELIVGTAMSTLTVTPSGGTSYTFKTYLNDVLPTGLSLNSSSGQVTGTPTAAGTTSVRFLIEDVSGAAIATDPVEFEVVDVLTVGDDIGSALTITATKSSAYSYSLISTGGRGTPSWALTSGSLPTGLSLSSTGVISGTPTATNAGAACTFTVTDDDLETDLTATVTIVVADVVSLTVGSLTFTEEVAEAQSFIAVDGAEPITFALDDGDVLPDGLILLQDYKRTCVIAGTVPNGTGSASSFTLNCTDANGSTDDGGLTAVTIAT